LRLGEWDCDSARDPVLTELDFGRCSHGMSESTLNQVPPETSPGRIVRCRETNLMPVQHQECFSMLAAFDGPGDIELSRLLLQRSMLDGIRGQLVQREPERLDVFDRQTYVLPLNRYPIGRCLP